MSNGIKTPKETLEVFLDSICVNKVKLPVIKLILLGILAGAYISFGGELMNIVSSDMGNKLGFGLSKLIGGAVFSLGLILVVVAGGELFTGNTLLLGGLFRKKITTFELLRNWIIVYFSNFLGSLLIVLLIYLSGQWKLGEGVVGVSAIKIALSKVNLTWIESFTRGILANWLVCLAVWMALASQDMVGKVLSIFFPIMAFVASGFEHSVANMYLVPVGIVLKNEPSLITTLGNINLSNLTWNRFIIRNLIPSTLGNIIGGGIFVSLIYAFIYYTKEKIMI